MTPLIDMPEARKSFFKALSNSQKEVKKGSSLAEGKDKIISDIGCDICVYWL